VAHFVGNPWLNFSVEYPQEDLGTQNE
jgi:hypothetical protein